MQRTTNFDVRSLINAEVVVKLNGPVGTETSPEALAIIEAVIVPGSGITDEDVVTSTLFRIRFTSKLSNTDQCFGMHFSGINSLYYPR